MSQIESQEDMEYYEDNNFPEGNEMTFEETCWLLELSGNIAHRRYIDKGD